MCATGRFGDAILADMPADLIRSGLLSDVAQYAYAAAVPEGTRLVFLAGSCPLDESGVTVGTRDYLRQAEQCVANLRTVLGELSADITDLVSTRVLVASTDQQDLGAAWHGYRAAIAPHDPPSTLLGVTVLGYDHQLVEIEAVAAIRC